MDLMIKMNLTATFLIIGIFLFRQLFKSLPRKYFYILWILVLFRLLCPVFIPVNITHIDSVKEMSSVKPNDEEINSQTMQLSKYDNNPYITYPHTPNLYIGSEKWRSEISFKTIVYPIILAGIIVLSIVTLIQYIFIMKKIKGSQYLKDNIYICQNIDVPFVLGFIKPRIYLPAGIHDPTYIIYHENVHIVRRDYIIKILFWLAVILHWYNPLVWLAFSAMEKDMEMSCDERVITIHGNHIRKNYSEQLLELATGNHQNFLPIHFINGSIMQRINNIFQEKKRPNLFSKLAAIIVISCIMTGCMLAPKPEQNDAVQVEQSTPLLSGEDKTVTAPPAKWSMNTLLDPEIPDLDYASDSKVIFHGYFGLFVYDIKAEKIVNSLDLKSIGCQKIQNDGATKVSVSTDGNLIFLYPYQKDFMYIFDLTDNSLKKSEPEEMKDAFNSLASSRDVLPDTDKKIRLCSGKAVSFADGSFGYLYLTGESISNIIYVRDDKEWMLLTDQDNPEPLLTRQDDSFYKAFALKASESFETFIGVYAMMFDLRDYTGICSLTKGIEYSEDMQREWQKDNLRFFSGEEIKPEENGRSCYKVEIKNLDNINETSSIAYLYLIHGDEGWYADGFMHQDPPESDWWVQ